VEFSFDVLLLLMVVALFAGWVDAIAGGGGLITVPVLLLVGLPPAGALATNKLQGSAGSLSASFYFIKNKTVKLSEMKLAIAATFVGSVLGAGLLLRIEAKSLSVVLPFLLIAMGLYFLLSPNINDKDRRHRLTMTAFALLVAPFLGFYDGFFGPGTGSFMALALVMLLGYGLPKATAHAKILNFVSNLSSLLYFILYGEIYWQVGMVMIVGQVIGATIGAKMILDKGSAMIKPIVVTVCFVMSVNILWQYF